MAAYRPPMYSGKRGRKFPPTAEEKKPEEVAAPEEKKPEGKRKRKLKFSEEDYKDDLYLIAKKMEIEDITRRSTKEEILDALREHPDAEEKE